MPASKFVASIADIKYLKDMPEEFMPYVSFKAGQEGRNLQGNERVAILNVPTTTSYIAVFLDKGKTIKDIEREVEAASVVLNTDTRQVLKALLEGQV